MELSEAWVVLGEDVSQLFHSTFNLPDIESKMEAVDKACRIAERSAKRLLGKNHPDKNPGDPAAVKRYMEISEALKVIRDHTEEFRKKVSEILERRRNPPDGHIQIG